MRYQIVLANEYEKFKFNYELNDDNPTKIWSSLMNNSALTDLRSGLNPWRGINSEYNKTVEKLNLIIDNLNEWLPIKINSKWDLTDPTKSLNNLHIHFPEQTNIETDPTKQQQLATFNDLIHGLEMILRSKTSGNEHLYLLLSYNHRGNKKDIDYNDFKFFRTNINFGDLTLHYCHVGRHPLEIFSSKDTDIPSNQIIPQHQISASHSLRFFNVPDLTNQFKKFYQDSNINWPYSIDDPRLALGYINLGKLESINEKQYSQSEIINIVKSCNSIQSQNFLLI